MDKVQGRGSNIYGQRISNQGLISIIFYFENRLIYLIFLIYKNWSSKFKDYQDKLLRIFLNHKK